MAAGCPRDAGEMAEKCQGMVPGMQSFPGALAAERAGIGRDEAGKILFMIK